MKITKAKLAILKHLYTKGPYYLFASRGFTGLAKAKYSFSDAPIGYNKGAHDWLAQQKLIEPIAGDPIAEVWGISNIGVQVLKQHDNHTSQIDDRISDKFINQQHNKYKLDKHGLISEQPNKDHKSHIALLNPNLNSHEREFTAHQIGLLKAERIYEAQKESLADYNFARRLNLASLMVQSYFNEIPGSYLILITAYFDEEHIYSIDVDYRGRSYDAEENDKSELNKLLMQLKEPRSTDTNMNAFIEIKLWKTRKGFNYICKLPDDFNPGQIYYLAHHAVEELKPENLWISHQVDMIYSSVGLKHCGFILTGVLNRFYDYGHQWLNGKNGHKFTRRLKDIGWEKGNYYKNRKVIRRMHLSFDIKWRTSMD